MPTGQSFEMTQEKPVSLILKLRRANNFVINVIVYSESPYPIAKVCHPQMNKNKNFEIQIEYFTEKHLVMQHVPL